MANNLTIRSMDSDPSPLRLVNATVVDTRTGELTRAAEIVLRNGKIESVASGKLIHSSADMRTINAAGRYVVPGFLDMHVHSVEQEHPEDNLGILLAYGVTGIRQMAGSPELLQKRGQGGFAFGTAGPELLEMPGTILTGGNAATAEQAVEEVRKQKEQGADFIKTISVTPKAFFASLAEATRLGMKYGGHMSPGVDMAEASDKGVDFIEHLGGPFEMLLIKCSKMEWLLRVLLKLRPPAATKMSDADLKSLTGKLVVANPILFLLKSNPKLIDRSRKLIDSFSETKARDIAATFARNQTWHCPTLIRGETMRFADENRITDSPDTRYLPKQIRDMYLEFSRQYAELLTPQMRETLKLHKELALRVTKILDEAGVPMMTGSDYGGGWVIPGVSIHQEFDLLEQAGLTPLRVLQMTTIEGARFLKREATMGTIDVGKDANLVLIDGDPTASVQNLHKLAAVIRAGRFYDRDEMLELRERVASRLANTRV